MAKIAIWAPKPKKVELLLGQNRKLMQQEGNGWWGWVDSSIKHGSDYSFYVDGKGPFPDPRSSWQPEGVNGPSRWVDHQIFAWDDAHWHPPSKDKAIFYEIHIGTFTPEGTFDAAIEHLDYLVDLGVTHVELMPVAEFSGSHGWGYDEASLYAPHHAYGGSDGLKRFVNACHQRDLAAIQDVVYNHLGPIGNYLSQYGPYFTPRYATPWGEAVNLDGPDSGEVRQFLIDNALMWLKDYHFDGLRLDAIHAIFDSSAVHFLEELQTNVKTLENQLNRPLMLIAESDLNDPRVIRPVKKGGYGIDAQWNEDFHHALHAVLTKERQEYYQDFGSIAQIAKVLTEGFAIDGCYSPFRRHKHGRPAKDIPANQFVGYLQNHDQIGNRAFGERISHLVSIDKVKVGLALVLLGPFLPLLFQGEEWAASAPFLYFTDHEDLQLGNAVFEGRKKEFSALANISEMPHPQEFATFLRSKLDWKELIQEPHKEVLEWTRALIRARQKMEGELVVQYDEKDSWLVMNRGDKSLICNFGDQVRSIPCQSSDKKLLLISKDGIKLEDGKAILPGHSAALCGI